MLNCKLPPVHPGEILKEEFIIPRGLTIKNLAEGLKINRTNLSHVVNEHAGISVELAVKLSKAFKNTPQFWINLQSNYDLWHAQQKLKDLEIKDFSKYKIVA